MDATPKGLTATTGDNASVTLTKGDTEHPSFGVSVTEYTFAGDTTTPAMHVTVTVGSTIGLKDPDGGKQARSHGTRTRTSGRSTSTRI